MDGRRRWGWRTHVLVFAVVAGGALGIWQLTRDPHPPARDYGADYWWPVWFAFGWAVVVLLHYVFTHRPAAEPATAEPAAAPPAEPVVDPRLAALTAREREILTLVAAGHSNKEIARQLVISERTARTHVSNILRKLELPSRTQAALLAVRSGLTPGAAPERR